GQSYLVRRQVGEGCGAGRGVQGIYRLIEKDARNQRVMLECPIRQRALLVPDLHQAGRCCVIADHTAAIAPVEKAAIWNGGEILIRGHAGMGKQVAELDEGRALGERVEALVGILDAVDETYI